MTSTLHCRLIFLCTCVTCASVLLLHSAQQNEWKRQTELRYNRLLNGSESQVRYNPLLNGSESQVTAVLALGKHVTEKEDNTTGSGLKSNITLNNGTLRHVQYVNKDLSNSHKTASGTLHKEDNKKGTLINLDTFVPSVEELYDRLVLVTAISSNHYNEAMGFIGSAQKQMPGKKIIVYDLGLNQNTRKKVKSLCNVELRPFPFNAYPPHVRSLRGTYAFKPILISLALNEFGAIYYGDASIRFLKSLKELLPGIERHHGYMTVIRGFDPRHMEHDVPHHYFLTVPEMFDKLEVDRDEYFQSNFSAPHIQPGTQLIINSTTIQNKLIQPYLNCALEEACIAPPGSSRRNHRQDASAISLIVYKNMYREWTPEDNDTEKMRSVIVVLRDSNGFKYQPKYC